MNEKEEKLFQLITTLMNGVKVYKKKSNPKESKSNLSYNPFEAKKPSEFGYSKVIAILNITNNEIQFINPTKVIQSIAKDNKKKINIRLSSLQLTNFKKMLIPNNTKDYLKYIRQGKVTQKNEKKQLFELSLLVKSSKSRADLLLPDLPTFTLLHDFFLLIQNEPKLYIRFKSKIDINR